MMWNLKYYILTIDVSQLSNATKRILVLVCSLIFTIIHWILATYHFIYMSDESKKININSLIQIMDVWCISSRMWLEWDFFFLAMIIKIYINQLKILLKRIFCHYNYNEKNSTSKFYVKFDRIILIWFRILLIKPINL